MDVSVEVRVEGADVTARRLQYLADRLSPTEMMETNAAVIKVIEEYHKSTWGNGIEDDPGTVIRWPDQVGPLWLTGTLRASMTDSDAEGAVRKVTPVGFEYGTSIYYGRFLQDGTSKMPPKPFVKFNTPIKVAITKVYKERLFGAGFATSGISSGNI